MTNDRDFTKLSAIKVISKAKWLEYKQIFKQVKVFSLKSQCKKELFKQGSANDESYENCSRKPNDVSPNSLLKLVGIPDGISKQEILIKLKNYKPPCFVDYISGNSDAMIRFYTPKDKAEFLEVLKTKDGSSTEMMMKYSIVKVLNVTGEEEQMYLQKVQAKKDKFKKEKK